MEVPLENQTKECLIAYIRSLESQSKHDENRMAVYKTLAFQARRLLKSYKESDAALQMLAHKGLYVALDDLDALTPTQEGPKFNHSLDTKPIAKVVSSELVDGVWVLRLKPVNGHTPESLEQMMANVQRFFDNPNPWNSQEKKPSDSAIE